MIVVLVDDRMDHDRLFVYCNRAVRGDSDPIVCQNVLVSAPNKGAKKITVRASMRGHWILNYLVQKSRAH